MTSAHLLDEKAEAAASPTAADEAASPTPEVTPVAAEQDTAPKRRWLTVLGCLAVAAAMGLSALTGYFVWHHRQVQAEQQRLAEYAAAADQIVVTLMSVDAANAHENVAAIIDNSAGSFRDEFEFAADDFVQVAQDSKVSTTASVQASAVQSMTADGAEVLVTATSTVSNAAGAKEAPRSWRLKVSLVDDGDRIRMSQLEFVP